VQICRARSICITFLPGIGKLKSLCIDTFVVHSSVNSLVVVLARSFLQVLQHRSTEPSVAQLTSAPAAAGQNGSGKVAFALAPFNGICTGVNDRASCR